MRGIICCVMKFLIAFALWVAATPILSAAEPTTMNWTVDGVQREAFVFLPSTPATTKAPVIFAFHGHGGNMRFAARGMAFQKFWPEAIVVYPQGLPTPGLIVDRQGKRPGWQRGPGQEHDRDLKLVDAILAALRKQYSVNDRRIYATGFSNGGLFTYLLWAERPNVFAAFAPGSAVLLPSVRLTEPRPLLHYGGRADRLAKFAKQEETIDKIRRFNGCAPAGEPCGVNCTLYPSSKGAPVETFIHPFGHVYPPLVTALIVRFFQEHPRK
jgi:polyhydroxybutyrate depolymerase